jgi:pimeloyl-ACP methyl ester carboxylesterase
VSIVIGLVLLVIQAYRSRQVRRVVAILWDIVTFWPRANHPLTPPSYGKRTVWDLRLRMADLCSASGELDDDQSPIRVVLVAHSQGTIIAAATLMQARESTEQYPLLTFGSPLRRLYARNFPAYFGHDAMTALKDRRPDPKPRWINLWSLTDPIGGRVFESEFLYVRDGEKDIRMEDALANVDCRILDVQQQDPDSGTDGICLNGAVCGHSGFWVRGEYDQAVDALEAIVVPKGDQTVSAATVAPKIEAV